MNFSISCGCVQPFFVHCHWSRQSCLSHAKAPSSLWHGISSSHFLSLTLHSFPSIWKTSSIIPIHKMGKPLDSPASFRPISLTSCVSKLFEGIILFRLLFYLESNSILSPCQAGFHPGRSTLNQILYLSQMGLTNPGRALGRSCLILISLKLLTVWHPTLFHKLISADLPPCFTRWTQSFLCDRCACMVYQNHKSHSF